MAKSTPSRAAKSAPSSASKPSPAPTSASKKRVRVVEGEQSPAVDSPAPSSASKKAKSAAKPSPAATAAAKEDASAAVNDTPSKGGKKTGKNGVVLADLRDKKLDEIEPIKSKDAPTPQKGALKKGKGKAAEKESKEEEVISVEVEAGEGADAEDVDEEEIDFLEGFESGSDEDGADSSDEEMEEEDEEAKKRQAALAKKLVAQLPKVQGGDKAVEKKLEKEKKEKKAPRSGTVYLGRIPKGFYEEEMRSYFSQFGEVTRLRLSRNKQTGASKHYAFLEFKYESVATIVQETMDNYLLSGHILVCKVVPNDQVHPKLWVGANRKFRVVPKARKELKRRAAPKTDAQKATSEKRLLTREDKKRKQLADLGIEYEFSGFAGKEVESEEKTEEEKKDATPAKGKKGGRKSAGGEPAAKKPRKSK